MRVKRTILVTGASSGIGQAVSQKMLNLGHTVIGLSRNEARFSEVNKNFTPVEIDLSELKQLPDKIRALEHKFPSLDTVVFCAGIGRFGALEQFSYAQIEAMITLNLTSQVFLARGVISGFKKKPLADLVFIGSEASLKGRRKGTVYCASKFALRGFTQALREECAKSNVRVSLINPGMVKTPFFEDLSFEPGGDQSNYILPEEIADAVSYVLNTRAGVVIDEINLNPLNKVINFKSS